MPIVLLVTSDLLFRSRIDDATRQAGHTLRVAKSMEQLDRHLAAGSPDLVIVDLEMQTMNAGDAIRRLREGAGGPGRRIVAYAGHTNVDAIRDGRAAGAGVVLARSGLVAQLPGLLQSLDA